MPSLRHNPITGQWVIIAENRGGRPRDFVVQQTVRESGPCPFCEGHELQTPGEVFALRKDGTKPDSPGWQVRVIPNKYPATTEEPGVGSQESEARPLAPAGRPGMTGTQSLASNSRVALHEVIIESPRHALSFAELSDGEVAKILATYRERMLQLDRSHPTAHVVIFKNSGPAAGATLAHLHSQLIASEFLTDNEFWRMANLLKRIDSADESQLGCTLCSMVSELPVGLIVARSPRFIAFCPFASRFPYETWILPLAHAARYDQLNPESLPELASLFRSVLLKLEKVLQSPAYNYILHTAPFDTGPGDHYHWHIEILPRTATLGGFELGTGCFINPLAPERAAEELRRA